MSPKYNFNNLKKSFSKKKDQVRGMSLTDATVYYRKILKRVPDISHLKNIVLFGGVATLVILILFAQRFSSLASYIPRTPLPGGTFTEGMVGKIEQLNPLYSPTNSAEQAAVSLIFSGLTKKDGNRQMIPDLAQKWEISPDGKTYKFYLRDNIFWQDGSKITADDIVFTVATVQNPDTRSPLMEVWRDVNVTAENEKTVTIKLKTAYTPFIANTDLPILPKHLLSEIPVRNLKIAEFSLNPVGSGPFKFDSLKKIKENEELTLVPSENFWGKKPYLEKIILKTYSDENKMVAGYGRKEVLAIEKVPTAELNRKNLPNMNLIQLSIPDYDASYFNLRKGISKDKAFREAVSLAVNRRELAEEAYQGNAFPIFTPILPGYIGFDPKLKNKPNTNTAIKKMREGGYKMGKDGFFYKKKQKASLRLVSSDSPEISDESDAITRQLKKIGIEVRQEKYPMGVLVQDHIRPRDFDLLLVTQNLGYDSDLYAFWHATQVSDPGLNFSGFTDRRLDKAIEQARQTQNQKIRKEKYLTAQKLIWDETPAVFLLWPNYFYGVSRQVKGIENERLVEPSNRFWNVSDWYLKDKQSY